MKTTPVTFCNSSLQQFIDHGTKSTIFNAINQYTDNNATGTDNSSLKHRVIHTPKDASFLRNPHVMMLATRAHRYWLYLTQVEHRNVCVLVERNIKPGYPFPKMLHVPYQFNDVLHQNTLMEVEVIEDAGGVDAPLMLVSDLVVLKNLDARQWDPIKRHNTLHTIFDKQFHDNPALQPCAVHIKRLFTFAQWNDLRTLAQALPYDVRGLVFLPLNTRYPMRLWLDNNHELSSAQAATVCQQNHHEPNPFNNHHRGKGYRQGKGGGYGQGKGYGRGQFNHHHRQPYSTSYGGKGAYGAKGGMFAPPPPLDDLANGGVYFPPPPPSEAQPPTTASATLTTATDQVA